MVTKKQNKETTTTKEREKKKKGKHVCKRAHDVWQVSCKCSFSALCPFPHCTFVCSRYWRLHAHRPQLMSNLPSHWWSPQVSLFTVDKRPLQRTAVFCSCSCNMQLVKRLTGMLLTYVSYLSAVLYIPIERLKICFP